MLQFARQLGRPRLRLTLANVQELQGYDWPGNVRELQHALERACIVAADGRLKSEGRRVGKERKAAGGRSEKTRSVEESKRITSKELDYRIGLSGVVFKPP